MELDWRYGLSEDNSTSALDDRWDVYREGDAWRRCLWRHAASSAG
jgi:hypothetical protein